MDMAALQERVTELIAVLRGLQLQVQQAVEAVENLEQVWLKLLLWLNGLSLHLSLWLSLRLSLWLLWHSLRSLSV